MRERHEHKRMHGRREHLEQRGHRHASKDSKDGIRDLSDQHHKKAQTFRRGRAINFNPVI